MHGDGHHNEKRMPEEMGWDKERDWRGVHYTTRLPPSSFRRCCTL